MSEIEENGSGNEQEEVREEENNSEEEPLWRRIIRLLGWK